MTEIFDVLTAVNKLKDSVNTLNSRVDYLIKNPALITSEKYVDQETACKLLHIGRRELLRMRAKCEIPYTYVHRKLLYPLADIQLYLKNHTYFPVPPS